MTYKKAKAAEILFQRLSSLTNTKPMHYVRFGLRSFERLLPVT